MPVPDWSKSSDADSTKSIYLADNLNPKQILKKILLLKQRDFIISPNANNTYRVFEYCQCFHFLKASFAM